MFVKNARRDRLEGCCATCTYMKSAPGKNEIGEEVIVYSCHNVRSHNYRMEFYSNLIGCPCWSRPIPAAPAKKKKPRR